MASAPMLDGDAAAQLIVHATSNNVSTLLTKSDESMVPGKYKKRDLIPDQSGASS